MLSLIGIAVVMVILHNNRAVSEPMAQQLRTLIVLDRDHVSLSGRQACVPIPSSHTQNSLYSFVTPFKGHLQTSVLLGHQVYIYSRKAVKHKKEKQIMFLQKTNQILKLQITYLN